jgi:hypothetical protein
VIREMSTAELLAAVDEWRSFTEAEAYYWRRRAETARERRLAVECERLHGLAENVYGNLRRRLVAESGSLENSPAEAEA